MSVQQRGAVFLSSMIAVGLVYVLGLLAVVALLMSLGGSGGLFVFAAVACVVVALAGRVKGAASMLGVACLAYVVVVLGFLTVRVVGNSEWGWAYAIAAADVCVLADLLGKLRPRMMTKRA